MAVTLSVKNVPDELADKLRERAAANHRSMQGELLFILDQALAEKRTMSLADVWGLGEGWDIEPLSESEGIVRSSRDGNLLAIYWLPAKVHEASLEKLEDLELNAIADGRAKNRKIKVSLSSSNPAALRASSLKSPCKFGAP